MAFPTGWGRRVAITVGTVTGTHTNFPLLLNEDVLGDALAEAQNGGGDLRFSSDSAGATQLACDVVVFNTSTVKAVVWVKVPSLATSTVIYAWWDTAGTDTQPAASDTYGSQAVWADYAAVYHGNTLNDATGNGGTLTADAGASAADATTKTGSGSLYSPTDKGFDSAASLPAFTTSSTLTMSTWFNTASRRTGANNFLNPLVSWMNSAETDGVTLGIGVNGSVADELLISTYGSNTQTNLAGTTLSGSTFYRVAVVWEQTAAIVRFYVNGALDTTVTSYGDTSSSGGASKVRIGDSLSANGPEDYQEAVFFRLGVLSTDWYATEYANQNDPGTFATEGTPDTIGTTTQELTPSLFTNTQTFYGPTVSPGTVTLTPALFTNTQTFYGPTVSLDTAQTITAPLVTNGQTFYAATVSPGTVTLTAPLVTNTQTFYSPTVAASGPQTITVPLLTNVSVFYSPTITSGSWSFNKSDDPSAWAIAATSSPTAWSFVKD